MKMKKLKIWHAIPIMALMVVSAVSCNNNDEIKVDFNVTVPDSWIYYVLSEQGYVYSAQRVPVDNQDSIREYLAIYKEPLAGMILLPTTSQFRHK